MSTTEIVLNMLAETSVTDISREEQPQTFAENRAVEQKGGEVAGIARRALEERTGRPVVTSRKAVELHQLLTELLVDAADLPDHAEKK